jgi:hypothetical protein
MCGVVVCTTVGGMCCSVGVCTGVMCSVVVCTACYVPFGVGTGRDVRSGEMHGDVPSGVWTV